MYPPQNERKIARVVVEMPGRGAHKPDENITPRRPDQESAAVFPISHSPRLSRSNPPCCEKTSFPNESCDSYDDCLYVGTSEEFEVVVTSTHNDISQASLHPRSDLRNYSYSYGWGRQDGPALQLSLALLASALNSDRRAFLLHEWFAAEVIANMDPDAGWVVSKSHVRRLVSNYEKIKSLYWNDQDQVYVEEAIP